MFFEHSAKVFHIDKSCHHRHIEHGLTFLDEQGGTLQPDEPDKILWGLAGECFQPTVEKCSAHSHLCTQAVDIEIGIGYVGHNNVGGFIYKLAVGNIQRAPVNGRIPPLDSRCR